MEIVEFDLKDYCVPGNGIYPLHQLPDDMERALATGIYVILLDFASRMMVIGSPGTRRPWSYGSSSWNSAKEFLDSLSE